MAQSICGQDVNPSQEHLNPQINADLELVLFGTELSKKPRVISFLTDMQIFHYLHFSVVTMAVLYKIKILFWFLL